MAQSLQFYRYYSFLYLCASDFRGSNAEERGLVCTIVKHLDDLFIIIIKKKKLLLLLLLLFPQNQLILLLLLLLLLLLSHLRYSSKFALTHTCTCMSIVTLHLLNFLSFLTSPIVYYLCKLFLGLCYFSYYACILAVPLQVYKFYCSFIILFSHEFH